MPIVCKGLDQLCEWRDCEALCPQEGNKFFNLVATVKQKKHI